MFNFDLFEKLNGCPTSLSPIFWWWGIPSASPPTQLRLQRNVFNFNLKCRNFRFTWFWGVLQCHKMVPFVI